MKSHDVESDPNGKKQFEPGAKLDAGKPASGLLLDFGAALTEVAKVGTFGMEKYARGGWLHVPNGVERYTDAMMRHLLLEAREPVADDSGILHASHTAWNALARLELMLKEKHETS